MSLVPVDTFREHIKAEAGTAEEAAIQAYLDGAESAVARHLCRPLIASDATPADDSYELPLPPDVSAAILLLAGHLYANREAVVTGTIATALPLSVQFLLAPYKVWEAEPETI